MNSSSVIAIELLDFPDEILFLIAKQLTILDLIALCSTSHFARILFNTNALWKPHFDEAFDNPPCLYDCLDLQKKPQTFFKNSFFRKKGISKISDSKIKPSSKYPYFGVDVFGKNIFNLFHQWNYPNDSLDPIFVSYNKIQLSKSCTSTIDFSNLIQYLIPDFPLKNREFLKNFKEKSDSDIFEFFSNHLNKPKFTLPISYFDVQSLDFLDSHFRENNSSRLKYLLIDFSKPNELGFSRDLIQMILKKLSEKERKNTFIICFKEKDNLSPENLIWVKEIEEKYHANLIYINHQDENKIKPFDHMTQLLVQTLQKIYTPKDFSENTVQDCNVPLSRKSSI